MIYALTDVVRFLQTIFPLTATGASLLYISLRWFLWIINIRESSTDGAYADVLHSKKHSQFFLNGNANATEQYDPIDEQDVTQVYDEPGPQNDPTVIVDRPRAQHILVAVELAAVLGQLAIHALIWSTQALGRATNGVSITGVITWAYILILVLLRAFFNRTTRTTTPSLWNQTASLYCLHWTFSVFIFRSALIHQRHSTLQGAIIVNFSLATVLILIALGSRRGNRLVTLEYERNLKPSKEPLASLFSIATFSWVDAIVWHGYKNTYEIADVWNLAPKDKAAAILANYRQLKKTTKLVWHLLRYFKRGLLIQGAWAIANGFLTFVPTLLLKAILEYVENPDEIPVNAAWFYVILLACSSIAEGVTNGQGLWIGRKICIRLRAVIIGEIYAKALRRKAASATDKVLGDATERNDREKADNSLKNKILRFGRKKKAKSTSQETTTANNDDDSQVNTGTIINLMAVDSFKLSDISAYLHFLWGSSPIQLIVCILLLYRVLGTSFLNLLPKYALLVV